MIVSLHDASFRFVIVKIYQYKFTASWTKFGHVRKNQFIDRKSFYFYEEGYGKFCRYILNYKSTTFHNRVLSIGRNKYPANK